MRVVPPSHPCSRRAALAVAALYVSAPLGGRPAAAAVEGIPFYARGDQQMLPDQGFEVLLPELIELRGVALPSVRRAVDNADWAEGRRLLEGRGGRDAALATLGSTASILGDEACARHAPAQHTKQRVARAERLPAPRALRAHPLLTALCPTRAPPTQYSCPHPTTPYLTQLARRRADTALAIKAKYAAGSRDLYIYIAAELAQQAAAAAAKPSIGQRKAEAEGTGEAEAEAEGQPLGEGDAAVAVLGPEPSRRAVLEAGLQLDELERLLEEFIALVPPAVQRQAREPHP